MELVIPMIGLYIHIPFCQNICYYCDFKKRVSKNSEMIKNYLNRLILELKSYEKYFNEVRTIYIGGGTPSILNEEELELLFNELQCFKNIKEFNFEANPESLTEEKIKILKKYNVNRVSLGVQTFNEDKLKLLGRKHTNEMVYECINNLKKHNINNINIDLMFALPYQKIEEIKYDLDQFYHLDIPHLSYYSLILEEKTVFYHQYLKNNLELVDNSEEANMYEYIIDDLKKHGYKHYEISNFSKDKESIHNKIYWENKEYIGVGMGACGYLDGIRYENNYLYDEYMKNFRLDEIRLNKLDKIKEEFMLGLRMIDGVNIKKINEKYQINAIEMFNLKKYIDEGYLKYDGNLSFTKKGLLLGNEIFMIFVGEDNG